MCNASKNGIWSPMVWVRVPAKWNLTFGPRGPGFFSPGPYTCTTLCTRGYEPEVNISVAGSIPGRDRRRSVKTSPGPASVKTQSKVRLFRWPDHWVPGEKKGENLDKDSNFSYELINWTCPSWLNGHGSMILKSEQMLSACYVLRYGRVCSEESS